MSERRFRWSARELKALDLYDPHWFSLPELSERLARSKWAVRNKIAELGLRRRRYKPWTPEEEARLLEVGARGFYKQDVALSFPGRSFGAVKQRLYELRKRQTVCQRVPTGPSARESPPYPVIRLSLGRAHTSPKHRSS